MDLEIIRGVGFPSCYSVSITSSPSNAPPIPLLHAVSHPSHACSNPPFAHSLARSPAHLFEISRQPDRPVAQPQVAGDRDAVFAGHGDHGATVHLHRGTHCCSDLVVGVLAV